MTVPAKAIAQPGKLERGERKPRRRARIRIDSRAGDLPWTLPSRMGFEPEIERMHHFIDRWLDQSDPEVRGILTYQLSGPSKYYRPAAMFLCHQAVSSEPTPEGLIRAAAAAELFHNYATVLDDIVDRDRYRRGRLALHCRFGMLPGLMAGAHLAFSAADFIADDEYVTRVFTELGKRIAVVECRQWRLRGQPFGIGTWREIAGEDTGGMFQACARVATRDDRLARFGYLLGTLYHGCDDVADLRGSVALGAHSDRDITDRILTLPAAIATQDPETARLFADEASSSTDKLAERLNAALPEAEAMLDAIAQDAEAEARQNARAPDGLIELVRATRSLSTA